MLSSYKNLEIWNDGIDLVSSVYQWTNSFPKEEQYGLVAQMRRASVSVPSNIAEGAERFTQKEYARFLFFSLSSLAELETQMIISHRLGYLEQPILLPEIAQLRRKILNFIIFVNSPRYKQNMRG